MVQKKPKKEFEARNLFGADHSSYSSEYDGYMVFFKMLAHAPEQLTSGLHVLSIAQEHGLLQDACSCS